MFVSLLPLHCPSSKCPLLARLPSLPIEWFPPSLYQGVDYTEDATPYASHFRPDTPVLTVTDALNMGSIATSPSSTKLFFDWYRKETNNSVSYQTLLSWAAFDLLEAAMYQSTELKANSTIHQGKYTNQMNPDDVMVNLRSSQVSSPIGRVVFDANRINSFQKSIVVQSLPSSTTAEIVFPSGQKTASMVYPMPTWDDRVYTWKLLKNSNAMIGVAIAVVCSVLLVAIIVTVTIKAREADVRMLHFGHVVAMCVACLIVVWAVALVWQADITQAQCDMQPWLVYVPASFMVHLNNLKAYRLSIFLRANGKTPKPFTHWHVMRATLLLTAVTVVLVGISVAIDPALRTRVVYDVYRPRLDEYHCVNKGPGLGLFWFLLVMHVIASIACVISVRNGSEAFRDGATIKEAFIILYAFIVITLVLNALGLSSELMQVLRVCMLGIGSTLFIFRMLISRCFRHW